MNKPKEMQLPNPRPIKYVKLGSFSLPELVIKDVLSKLDISDLKMLRLASATTNDWVIKYSSYYEKMIFKVESFESVKNSLIPKQCSKFYVMLPETEEFNRFLRRLGSQIKHLQLEYTENVEYLNSLVEFEYVCPKLTSIDLVGEWPMKEITFGSTQTPIRVFTKEIKQLSINATIGSALTSDYEQFQTFLRSFTNLDTFLLDFSPTMEFFDNYLFSHEMISYVKFRCGNNFPSNEDNYPFSKTFYPHIRMLEVDLQGIADFRCNALPDIFYRITVMHLGYRDLGVFNRVGLPFDRLHNITDLSIELGYFDLPEWDLDDRKNEIAFKKLRKLCLKITSACQERDIELATTVFGFPDNKVNTLQLEVRTNEGVIPPMNDLHLSVVELLRTFKRVTHLSLKNYYHLEWLTILENSLERLDVRGVEMFRNEDFIGDGLEDIEHPVFCRLQNLRHLSVARKEYNPLVEQGLADQLFEKVFSNMQLKSFDIQNFCPVSKKALEFLVGSVFADTIQTFPYSCIPEATGSGSDTDNPVEASEYYTPTEFEEFQQKHFKFFK